MNAARPGMGVAQILRIVLMLILLGVAVWLIYTIRHTLLPFGIAFVLSYILSPLVDRMEARGLRRVVGVLVIYLSAVGVVVVMSFTFVPILIVGLGDLKVRILGEKAAWHCTVVNEGDEPVRIERAESTHPDFDVASLPVELEPGARDTLLIQFSPSAVEARTALLGLYGYIGEAEDEVELGHFHLSANETPGREGVAAVQPIRTPGPAQVSLADSVHRFGRVRAGYLVHFQGQVRAMQPQLEETFPMLEGIDLAEELNQRTQAWATDMLKRTPEMVGTLISGITYLVIVPIVGFFFLSQGRAIKRAFIELIPNRYFEMVLNLIHRIDMQLGGYIRGLVLSVIIISLLSITGLRIIGLRDYLVVGIIAGLANVIPYLGPIIGIVVGVIAAMLQYSVLSAAVPVVVVFLFVQITDNIFVQPIVVGRSVNLHPLVVIFVVLVGNHLFGAVGMLLAVPVTAVVKVSAQTIYEGLRSYSVT